MVPRCLWLLGFAAGAAALGCAGAATHQAPPVPPEAKAKQVALGERIRTLDALVTELAPASGPDRPGDLSQDQAARFAAAWNGVLAAAEETEAAFGAYDPKAGENVRAWLEQYVRRAGTVEPRRVPDGAEAGPVASAALFNLLAFRQRQAEVEAIRGLGGIWWDVAGPNAGKPAVFRPEPCPDETRAVAPDENWAAGCLFLFRLEVPPQGRTWDAVAVARGVSGPAGGVEIELRMGPRYSAPTRRLGREPDMVPVPGWPAGGDALYAAVRDVRTFDFRASTPLFKPGDPLPEKLTPPVRLFGPDPVYTRAAFVAKVQGLMMIQCVLAKDGWVYDCRVLKGLPLMNQPVLDALVARHYRPVTWHGKDIDCNYVFNINLVMPGR